MSKYFFLMVTLLATFMAGATVGCLWPCKAASVTWLIGDVVIAAMNLLFFLSASSKTQKSRGTKGVTVGTLLVVLAFALTATAQTFPRWPQGQAVRIYTLANAFTDKEHVRITAAIESWRPLLPSGITLTLAGDVSEIQSCQGCATLDRKPTRKDEWGECKTVHDPSTNVAIYAEISIDPRAGSGDDFQRVAEHEIGHVLGLDHRAKSVMSPHPKRGPSGDDGVILRALYSDKEKANDNGSRDNGGTSEVETRRDSASGASQASRKSTARAGDSWYLQSNASSSQSQSTTTRGITLDISVAARAEAATLLALRQHGFTRTVSIQTLDANGNITGTYERISRMVLADNGERVEKVISKHSHLKDLRITKADEEDFSGAQMGLIDFADYRFTAEPVGVRVAPLNLNGRRFSGIVLIGDKGIYRLFGTTLPQKSERFPTFMAARKEVDGYLFPSEASGKGVLVFPNISIRVQWSVRESDYYRFGSRVNVKEIDGQ